MAVTLEKLHEDMQIAFGQFKSIDQKRDEEIKKFGEESALTKEALDKANTEITRLDTELQSALTKMNRPAAAGTEEHASESKAAFLQFCRGGVSAVAPEQQKHLLVAPALGMESKALTLGNDTGAGYLAPSEYVREIIKGIVEFSPVRERARVRSTSTTSIQIPKKTGMLTAQWVSEVGTKSETTGTAYGLEELPAHELYALVDVSNQQLEDSAFDIESELRMEFAEQFGVAEGTAFISGTGVGKPEGVLQNASISAVNSGDANTITGDGLIDLFYTLPDAYARNAEWCMKRATVAVIRKLKDGEGNYLWQPGITAANPPTILGQPYFEAPDMPTVAASTYPVVIGDWRAGYTIADRIQIAVLRDGFTQFASGKIRFIARKRVGGQVVLAEAFKKQYISA